MLEKIFDFDGEYNVFGSVYYDYHGGWAPGIILYITAFSKEDARIYAEHAMHMATINNDNTLCKYCAAAIAAIDNRDTNLDVRIKEYGCYDVTVQHPDRDKYIILSSSDEPGILKTDFELMIETLKRLKITEGGKIILGTSSEVNNE